MESYHSKEYLSHKNKYIYIKKLYENSDIVLLQDCHDELINELKNDGNINIIEPFKENENDYSN